MSSSTPPSSSSSSSRSPNNDALGAGDLTNFIPGIFFSGVPLILVVEKLSLLRGVGAKATVRRGVRGTLFEKLIRGRDGPARSNMQHQLPFSIVC